MTEPAAPEIDAETVARRRRAEIDAATPESEQARVEELAAVAGLDLIPAEAVGDVDPLVVPAARLFATLAPELRRYGLDPVPMLHDSRYDSLTKALERYDVGLAAHLCGSTYPNPPGVTYRAPMPKFERARIELDAVRGVEPVLLTLLGQCREAQAEHDKQARRRALTELSSPEEVSAVERILRGGASGPT